MATNTISDYNSIEVLDGLAGIRKRLGMYLGPNSSVDGKKMPKALMQSIQELLSNSLDEASIKNEKSTIDLIINTDENSIEITDEGRGVPKGPNDSFSEVINAFTIPHSSGKFDQKAYGSMGTAGMHGIGIKAVNAASKKMIIEAVTQYTTLKDGNIISDKSKKVHYSIEFKQDKIINQSQEIVDKNTATFTKIKTFIDDGSIDEKSDQNVFEDLFWNEDEINEMLSLNASLVPKAIIDFKFIKDGNTNETLHEANEGLLTYAKHKLNDQSDDFIYYKSPMFDYNKKLFQYDVVFKVSESPKVFSYANTVPTTRGGSHQEAIQNAFASAIQLYARQTDMVNKTLSKRVILNSLTVFIHAQIDNSIVTFEGQTKDYLATPLALHAIANHAKDALLDALYDNSEKANAIVEKIIENDALDSVRNKAEKAFKEASKNKSKKAKLSLLSKLKSASSKNPAEKELYIVEGDSASNIGRDLKTQAVFPIRGKIKNVYDLSLEESLKNKEVSTIIAAIGAGVGSEFDLDKMNYHKIILACFSGGTKVRSLDGNSYSFKELVDKGQKEIWTYAKDRNGNVVPALGTDIRKTGTAKEMLRITLDNEEIIESTPEHFFMDAEGQYKMAQDLQVQESLMPIYTRINEDGRTEYYDQNTNMYKPVYRMVAENILDKEREEAYKRLEVEDHAPSQNCIQVHHKDYNKLNDSPENLDWVTAKEHFEDYPPTWAETYNGSEQHKQDVKNAWARGVYDQNTWAYTYNGSKAQRENLRAKHARGDYKNATFNANGYNGSKKNSETATRVNKSQKHIDSVYRGSVLVGVRFLQDNNLPFDEYHYDFYRSKNSPRYSHLLDNGFYDSYEEIYEDAKTYPSRSFKHAHEYTNKYDVNKKQRNQIAKVIKSLIEQGLTFDEYNYNFIKSRGTTRYENITKWFESYEEAYEYAKHYNHKIVSIERIEYDEPIDVYCMTVENYHNFLLDGGVVVKNCDSDQDGSHIRSLLCGLFARFFPEIIEAGRLYVVEAPLYKIVSYKNGKPAIKMVYSESEMKTIRVPKGSDIERYKGLGEMELDEAKMALANPETRKLTRITMEDAKQAQHTLEVLLGSRVEERRKWARNLQFNDEIA